jgi:hypothetical protein
VPLLANVAPWIDPALSAVIAKALSRDVVARFATIGDMATALEPFGARRPLVQEDFVGVPSGRRSRVVSNSAAATHLDAKVTGDAVSITANKEPRRGRRWPGMVAVALALAGAAGVAVAVRGVPSGVPAPNAPPVPAAGSLGIVAADVAPTASASAAAGEVKGDASTAASASASAPSARRPRVDVPPVDGKRLVTTTRATAVTPGPAQGTASAAASVGRGFTATDLPPTK